MAWSPPALSAGIVWVSAPGDYATFNSNHTPDGTQSSVGLTLSYVKVTVISMLNRESPAIFVSKFLFSKILSKLATEIRNYQSPECERSIRGRQSGVPSALIQTDGTGDRSSFARMASA